MTTTLFFRKTECESCGTEANTNASEFDEENQKLRWKCSSCSEINELDVRSSEIVFQGVTKDQERGIAENFYAVFPAIPDYILESFPYGSDLRDVYKDEMEGGSGNE